MLGLSNRKGSKEEEMAKVRQKEMEEEKIKEINERNIRIPQRGFKKLEVKDCRHPNVSNSEFSYKIFTSEINGI